MKAVRRLALLFALSVAAGTLLAQAAHPSALPAPGAQSTPAHAAPPVPAPPPQLTETEQLKLENLQLRATVLKQQQDDVQNQFTALVNAINAEHPGWVLQPGGQFARIPEPPKPAAPAPAAPKAK